MQHFIFNLADGGRERAASFLRAKTWEFAREDAIAMPSLLAVSS